MGRRPPCTRRMSTSKSEIVVAGCSAARRISAAMVGAGAAWGTGGTAGMLGGVKGLKHRTTGRRTPPLESRVTDLPRVMGELGERERRKGTSADEMIGCVARVSMRMEAGQPWPGGCRSR